MGDLNHANTLLPCQLENKRAKRGSKGRIKHRGCFIKNQVTRMHGEYASKSQTLLFPARKRRRIALFKAHKAALLKSLLNALTNLRLGQA